MKLRSCHYRRMDDDLADPLHARPESIGEEDAAVRSWGGVEIRESGPQRMAG
jgi:hypothetical protein